MNIAAARRQQKSFDQAQAVWDAMTPDDDSECIDDDFEPDFEAMLETRSAE